MIHLNWLLTNWICCNFPLSTYLRISCWYALLGNILNFLRRCRSYGDGRNHLLSLNYSLVLNHRHLSRFAITRTQRRGSNWTDGIWLTRVGSTSVCKNWCLTLTWGPRPQATIQSFSSCAQWVSWSRLLQPSWQCTGGLVSDTSASASSSCWHKLPDVLSGRWAGQQRLWKQFRDLTIRHEWMHADLIQCWSCSGVSCQNSRNQIPRLIWYWHVVWERILIHLDSSVCGFDICGLKGRFTDD